MTDPVLMTETEEIPTRRRAFLAAGFGAVSAAVLGGLLNPQIAAAASVVLGGTNTSTKTTTFKNTATTATAKAITGRTTYTGAALNAAGVYGQADGTNASGVYGIANKGPKAAGVYGGSGSGYGVLGFGVVGVGGGGFNGLAGRSEDANGIGAYGNATGTDGAGVYGEASNGTGAAGVIGKSTTGYAGWFEGNVNVTGSLTTPAAFLQVDHPESPADRWYQQALVGAFERVTVLSGNAVSGANGRVVVRVPEIFGRTHTDVRYQVTPIGRAAQPFIAKELADGRFTIDAGAAGVRLSWQLTGVRDDAAARRGAFQVEADKRPHEQGRYADPALYRRSSRRTLRPRARTVGNPADARRSSTLDD